MFWIDWWPKGKTTSEFTSFSEKWAELSAHKGCLLWGSQVIVPPTLRKNVMTVLHKAHPRVVRMKALARSYVWWLGIDKEIEDWVKRCQFWPGVLTVST